ncbi:hypothetical protein A2662_01100 [Candidatus Giovannonibacteria bacterium RIFCSPHIGHO2_01_FULL_45_33]|uniref:Uncharacterized protein n=1 Tax=Candidatus Giovannonibacteria bacterium RIFCSPLOWO2_01_FULL_45_34 TaxID=1798351 RepID=A0A1F5X0X3_9BACT|nr:MAG: hypothetical protein A2662_01100 [Candidatus Giovannonibacteria bacterium RIFCSPHIGHO2_01_FULL_45_33]OGF69290.1 MAG: hypothetical protein A3C73_01615 [Candidatus Giovannonibacteria bacterium RIFCSPHIGHO2_02_FULL_44_11]OGF81555.1 MAG: hypothetical protein A2930_04085 [Candidatus Giovannonibacteria bacterium RIFCSPLOWO2_01_FULL_45_34]
MCQRCDAKNEADEKRARSAKKPLTQRFLGGSDREKIVQGNTCVILEPEVTSVCWDSKNKGGAVLADELSADDIKRFLPNGLFLIFNKDRSKIVGIEIT